MSRNFAITLGAFSLAVVVAGAMALLAVFAPAPPVSNPVIVFTHDPAKQPPVSSTAAQEGKQK